MNILITGGFGFLGFHLANVLKDLDCNVFYKQVILVNNNHFDCMVFI